jgi:hypothetical protein
VLAVAIVEIAVVPRRRAVQRPQAGAHLLGEDAVAKALCGTDLVFVTGPDGLQARSSCRCRPDGETCTRVEHDAARHGRGNFE